MIYLDHAATTPVPEEVAHAVYDTLVSGWGNPSSQYPIGKQARDAVAAARETIAAALGCKSEQFVFTSCGSESDNWAVRLALHQNRHVGKHIITTAVEHSAILETCKALEQEGYSVTYLKPDKNGDITASQVESALRDDTALVTMMLVNNETGCIFPVAEVAQLLKAKKSRALLHTDAVQAFLKIPFRADTLGADLISVSAHKLGAPKGIGGLYLGERIRAPKPLIFGSPTSPPSRPTPRKSSSRSTASSASATGPRRTSCRSRSSATRRQMSSRSSARRVSASRQAPPVIVGS